MNTPDTPQASSQQASSQQAPKAPFAPIPQSEDDAHVLTGTPRKSTWLGVYAALAAVALVCLVFIGIYRQMPKRSAPVKKRTVPATKNVFAMVLSPVDTRTAGAISQQIDSSIGKDSAVTQMIIGGTAVHKRCMSLDDFSRLSRRALTEAQPENLKRQAILLSYVAGVITADTLPTTLYIIGKIDESDYTEVEKRVAGAASAIGGWNRAFGNIGIVTYIPKPQTARGDSIKREFIAALRKQAPRLEERAMP
jgi:hypothetical protein